MTPNTKKKLLIFLWVILLTFAPITILNNLNRYLLVNRPVFYTVNIIQRVAGLWAFTMLFIQILIGSNMQKATQKFGSWIFKFHLTQAAILYSLIILHTVTLVIFNYLGTGKFNPFYVYTDFCLICKNKVELYYSLGRFSFWTITFIVLVAKFQTLPFWRRYWRYIHYLNYVLFVLIAIHAWFSGTDVWLKPFVYVYWLGVISVTVVIIRRMVILFSKIKLK